MSYQDPEDRLVDSMLDAFKNDAYSCSKCEHLNPDKISCKAFPDVIPEVIIGGHKRHTKNMFGQLNDIVFEEKE